MLCLLSASCGRTSAPDGSTGLAIAVKPLSLTGVSDVSYGLAVETAAGDVVWTRTAVTSTAFGDGRGGATYIGPCDASPGANPHRVSLTVESITDTSGHVLVDGTDFRNPAPVGSPIVLEADCFEGRDTPVTFNLTVLRSAEQGFFDVAVTFSDVFCSAKFDCVADSGGDIQLLNRPDGPRDTTVIMAMACTSGAGETTWLHFSDVGVVCGDPADGRTYWLDPAAGVGNTGPVAPIFFQTAVYQGQEQLEPYDKCYWNMAFGVNEGPAAADCRLVASATASAESWAPRGQMTPEDTVYPYVQFDVQVTDGNGQVTCGKNPLNGTGSAVQTHYTSIDGARFVREMQCGAPPTAPTGLACRGTIGGAGATFIESPDGVSVAFGPSVAGPELPDCAYAPHDPSCRSPLYALESGLHLGSCCANACCGQL